MIFKVYYQPNREDVPVRENTESLFLEAENEQEVRKVLKDRPFNIEFITPISGKALEHEQKNENYKLENV